MKIHYAYQNPPVYKPSYSTQTPDMLPKILATTPLPLIIGELL